MTIDFSRSLANATDFPPPTIFAAPRLRAGDVTLRRQRAMTAPDVLPTASGRNAVALAARLMERDDGSNRILMPAYHCPALIEPFLWRGYEVIFYPVQPDLSVDLDGLRELARRSGATHGVVIRFFGFEQNVTQSLQLMQTLGLNVLEDCAHALFDFLRPINAAGDGLYYRICSLNKFLPTDGGGALRPWREQQAPLSDPGVLAHAKSLVRMRTLNRPRRGAEAGNGAPGGSKTSGAHDRSDRARPGRAKPYRYFDPAVTDVQASLATRWLFTHSRHAWIAARRRQAFEHLAGALEHSPFGQPLYRQLGGAVPYVLPFLLDEEQYFTRLRMAGLQILRWEELADAGCAVSADYRRRLIQVPCHQGLSDADLAYIVEAFTGSGR